MEEQPKFKILINKYLAGTASKAEQVQLFNYYEKLQEHKDWNAELMGDEALVKHRILLKAKKSISAQPSKQRYKELKWAGIAAAVAILVIVFTYNYHQPQKPKQAIAVSDVQPGGNRATLTLSDGRKVILDDLKQGALVKELGVKIVKAADGQIIYDLFTSTSGEEAHQNKVALNTITTPVGGQYQLVLPDGSKVWLNALSSLRFPVSFGGNTRTVELVGEGYFEIAKNEKQPFYVKAGATTIKVMGTKFNVMAYTDENWLEATLLEGAINIKSGGTPYGIAMKPNEQAKVVKDEGIEISTVDTNTAIAWKEGYFHFQRENIRSVMKQLARWYDVEVVYIGELPYDEIVGRIRRSVRLSQVLKMLSSSNVNFKIDQNKVIVTSLGDK